MEKKLLKDNVEILLPVQREAFACSYSGTDDLSFALNIVELDNVELKNNGIRLIAKNKKGIIFSGFVKIKNNNKNKKEYLFNWFLKQKGKILGAIYSSNFEFLE